MHLLENQPVRRQACAEVEDELLCRCQGDLGASGWDTVLDCLTRLPCEQPVVRPEFLRNRGHTIRHVRQALAEDWRRDSGNMLAVQVCSLEPKTTVGEKRCVVYLQWVVSSSSGGINSICKVQTVQAPTDRLLPHLVLVPADATSSNSCLLICMMR